MMAWGGMLKWDVTVHGIFESPNSKQQIPNKIQILTLTKSLTALADWNVLSSRSYTGLLFEIWNLEFFK